MDSAVQSSELLEQLRALAPWHFDIPVGQGLRTIHGNQETYDDPDMVGVGTINTDSIRTLLTALYPEGLSGRSFLDAGCNGGAYCFLAKELGASKVVGFDVRDHWIQQAEFLRSILNTDSTDMQFLVKHLHEFEAPEKHFNATLFKGVFYHLPNPISALEKLCSLTKDVIIVDTASKSDIPANSLQTNMEHQTQVMSGVDRLAWVPGGPQAVTDILHWLGFTEFRVDSWEKSWPGGQPGWGRFRVIAAREARALSEFDAAKAR